jgi:hypothetical protein
MPAPYWVGCASVATHELGHTIYLADHASAGISLDQADPQTMYGQALDNRTETYKRSPARYGRWTVQRLYPNY